jgi:hypothetical protein
VVTYACIVIDHRSQKEDPNSVRITVGGNLITYPFELTVGTTDMVSSKLLWNSTIITGGTRLAGADIKNMYLETPLGRYEYMKMPLSLFLQDIIDHYGLLDKELMVTSTWRFARGCMVSYKLASWPTSFSRSTLPNTDTSNNHSLLVYGNTNPVQYGSTLQ